MIITVKADQGSDQAIEIPCSCLSVPDFYQGFYREFENCPPYRQGRYSMPEGLRAGYEKWKSQSKRLLPALRSKRIQTQI